MPLLAERLGRSKTAIKQKLAVLKRQERAKGDADRDGVLLAKLDAEERGRPRRPRSGAAGDAGDALAPGGEEDEGAGDGDGSGQREPASRAAVPQIPRHRMQTQSSRRKRKS